MGDSLAWAGLWAAGQVSRAALQGEGRGAGAGRAKAHELSRSPCAG